MGAIKRDSADRYFSEVVRKKAGKCEHCQKEGRLEAAHIFTRSRKSIRWSLLNCIALCHHCHRMFTGEPVKFTRWLENELLGPVALEILQERSNELVKTNAAYRKEVAAHYRSELKKMEEAEKEGATYDPISWN